MYLTNQKHQMLLSNPMFLPQKTQTIQRHHLFLSNQMSLRLMPQTQNQRQKW